MGDPQFAMLAIEGGDIDSLNHWKRSPDWTIEQKWDGDRMLVRFHADRYELLNRSGEPAGFHVNRHVHKALSSVAGEGFTFDGELLGDAWCVFDIAEATVLPTAAPWHVRRQLLETMFRFADFPDAIQLAPTARTAAEKEKLVDEVLARKSEGFIGKHVDSPYVAGKAHQSWVKVKLTSTIDCVVTGQHTERDGTPKESYDVHVFDPDDVHEFAPSGRPVPIGSCAWNDKRTRGRCEPGDVIEVLYLYTDTNRRMVQPRILRRRTDKPAEACTLDQLRPPTDKTIIRW